MPTRTFHVATGPSADRLINAFRYAFDDEAKVEILFAGNIDGSAQSFRAQVTSVQYQCGTPGSFIIAGIMATGSDVFGFQGYYDANRGMGNLELSYR